MAAKKKAKGKVDEKEIQKAFDKNRKEAAAKEKAEAVSKAKAAKEKDDAAAKKAAAKDAIKVDTALLDSLLAATGEKAQGKAENLKDFCYRLFVKMAEVPDDKFKALPKAARDWYDTNSDRYNAEKFDELEFLPGMHGFKAEAAAAEEAEKAVQEPTSEGQEETEETDVTKAKGKNKGMKASTAPKAPKVAKGKSGERKPRTEGTSYQVRIAVVKNPEITFEKLCEKLGFKGKEAAPTGHVHNMFAHAQHVMRLAIGAGYVQK